MCIARAHVGLISIAMAVIVSVLCPHLAGQTPPAVPLQQQLTFPVLAAVPNAEPVRSLDCVITWQPAAPVSAVAWSADGKLLAVGGYQEVLIWDLANGALLKRLGTGQMADAIPAVVFSADGGLLAVAEGVPYGAGAVKLFDIASGQVAAAFLEPRDATLCLALSPDGKWLAGAGVDSVVRIWDMAEKKLVAEMKGHSDWVRSISFSADGKLLASAGNGRSVLVWEVGTWSRVTELRENDPVFAVAFSPDAQFLLLAVVGTNDKVLRLRRRDNGQVARDLNLIQTAPLDVVWHAASNRVFVPCSDKTAKVYDGGSWGQVANLAGHGEWVYRAAVSGDGAKLATASADGTVKLWSAGDGRLLATLVQLSPRSDQWCIMTPAGYLATSSPASLEWRAVGLTMPPDQIGPLLQNIELVKQGLAGGAVAAPALQ
jgi:WD40 repeat protein